MFITGGTIVQAYSSVEEFEKVKHTVGLTEYDKEQISKVKSIIDNPKIIIDKVIGSELDRLKSFKDKELADDYSYFLKEVFPNYIISDIIKDNEERTVNQIIIEWNEITKSGINARQSMNIDKLFQGIIFDCCFIRKYIPDNPSIYDRPYYWTGWYGDRNKIIPKLFIELGIPLQNPFTVEKFVVLLGHYTMDDIKD